MTDSVRPTDDTVLVVDFGAQYAQLIARRVREAHVYSEIVPHDITAAEVAARAPSGIIFSGGPASVHVDGAPSIDPGVYELGVPILGICYGAQLLARDLGGEVARTGRGEYGRTDLDGRPATACSFGADPAGTPVGLDEPLRLHRRAPGGFTVTACTADAPVAAFEDRRREGSSACSSTPRWSTPPTARRCSSTSSTTLRVRPDRGR